MPEQARGFHDHEVFRKIAHKTAAAIGSPIAFTVAVLVVIAWALCGPVFHYSDTWQLVINTSTTIVTFLVVFMIQNTQNRDSRALHLKIDELILAIGKARNAMVGVEEMSDNELARLEKEVHARCNSEPSAEEDSDAREARVEELKASSTRRSHRRHDPAPTG